MQAEAPAGGDLQAALRQVKGDAADGKESVASRKIIQTAHVEVVVADIDRAYGGLKALVAANQVIVSKSEVTGDVGRRRGATWVLRVPADRFDAFVDGVAGLGRTVRRATEAQDVTEEFVDVEARLKNLKQEEETLNRLMKEKAQSTADLLGFRNQIKQVRGEIESTEGRLNVLSRLTVLSTVHLSMREERSYVPPTGADAPTFAGDVKNTWDDSLDALERFGRGVTLALVALTPWFPLLIPAVVVAWWQVRRVRRRLVRERIA